MLQQKTCLQNLILLLAAVSTATGEWTDSRVARIESGKIKSWLSGGDDNALRKYYLTWARSYGKGTGDGNRFDQFRAGLEKIVAINEQNLGFYAAPNKYTDLNFGEFKAGYTGSEPPPGLQPGGQLQYQPAPDDAARRRLLQSVPASVDWVKAGKVSPVKSQGGCGSCWAFSTVGALESKSLLATGRMLDLSEQNLIDCVNSELGYGSKGCSGGWPTDPLNYVYRFNITMEGKYPYKGAAGTCNKALLTTSTKSDVVAIARKGTKTGYESVTPQSAAALMAAVAKNPVITAFNVEESFQYYAGGIYPASSCAATTVNHAMLLVGYDQGAGPGSDSAYWLIKNSWNTGWGENGYARVQMTADGPGACAMYYYNYYPAADVGPPKKKPKPKPTTPSTPGGSTSSGVPGSCQANPASCVLQCGADNVCTWVPTGQPGTPGGSKRETCKGQPANCVLQCDAGNVCTWLYVGPGGSATPAPAPTEKPVSCAQQPAKCVLKCDTTNTCTFVVVQQ